MTGSSNAEPIDHSLTYRIWSLRNLPHQVRFRRILTICDSAFLNRSTYADFGCSNGYLTDIIARRYEFDSASGYDSNAANVNVARSKYGNVTFHTCDLILPTTLQQRYDAVSCFETLEHVGDPDAALQNLLAVTAKGGVLVISVPIEIGAIGLLKFSVKMALGYSLDELTSAPGARWRYLWHLLRGKVAQYRVIRREGWGTHFGFDYRRIDAGLKALQVTFKASNYGTTRFYVIRT